MSLFSGSLQATAPLALGAPTLDPTAARKTAQDFEAYFVSSMLNSMTAGMKADKLFGGGQAEDMFRSLMNQEYGKAIAKRGTFGVTPMVEREILKLQEEAQK